MGLLRARVAALGLGQPVEQVGWRPLSAGQTLAEHPAHLGDRQLREADFPPSPAGVAAGTHLPAGRGVYDDASRANSVLHIRRARPLPCPARNRFRWSIAPRRPLPTGPGASPPARSTDNASVRSRP